MGHSQWPIDAWWNNCTVACSFKYTTYSNTLQRTLFLVDIKKLLTHSTRPIIIAGGLILIYDFLLSRPRGLSSTTIPRAFLVPCVGWSDVIDHGSWVMWVMGQLCDGSHGSWVTKDDPFPSLKQLGLAKAGQRGPIIITRPQLHEFCTHTHWCHTSL